MRYFTWQSIPYSEHDEERYSECDSKCSVKRETQGKMTSSWAHPSDLCYKRAKRLPRGEKGEPSTRRKRESREVNVCVFWSQMTHLHRSVSLSEMRWARLLTHSHLSLFPLLFLFMGRLASDRGVLGDWCQWRWLLLLGLWQMVYIVQRQSALPHHHWAVHVCVYRGRNVRWGP